MASCAFQARVSAGKVKARLLVMIEMPTGPPDRMMALSTAGTEQTLVPVVARMAVAALRRRARELLAGVA